MEDFPSQLPEAKPNDNKDKKKKSRAERSNLRLPHIAKVEESNKAVPHKELKSLTDLLLEKQSAGSQEHEKIAPETSPHTPPKISEKQTPQTSFEHARTSLEADTEANPEAELKQEESTLDTPSKPEQDPLKNESYTPLPGYELGPKEFSGGEVIIHLSGKKPLVEQLPSTAEPQEAVWHDQSVPAFRQQPEQQHQARDSQPEFAPVPPEQTVEASPEPITPVSSEAVTVPPSLDAESAAYQPMLHPEQLYPTPVTSPDYAAPVQPVEQMVTKKEAEDTAYYAAKAAQNRGVVTGLLVGGAYEHFKHKRREKKQAKLFARQTKHLEQKNATQQQFQAAERLQQRAELNHRLQTAEKRFENTDKQNKLTKQPLREPEAPQQLAVPAEHRLETSAWHSIEVDAKTGKAVENPVFQYGREYYRERAQEALPTSQRNAATGEVALVAAAAASALPNAGHVPSQTPTIPNATTQGPPPSTTKHGQSHSSKKASKRTTTANGPVWPLIIALIVVVICLLVVLR